MISHLIAIDPGKRLGALAHFRDGVLATAQLIKNPSGDAIAWPSAIRSFMTEAGDYRCAIEWPNVHGTGRRVGDPNDLLWLTYMAGAVGTLFTVMQHVQVVDWKGSVPKEITKQRVKKVLSVDELARMKSKSSHAFDAVGIGLWTLQRSMK